MTVGAKFENIEDMKITVVASGTVAEFKRLMEHMDKNYLYPMSAFCESIKEQITRATNQVESSSIKS